jgi:hypothetical protein
MVWDLPNSEKDQIINHRKKDMAAVTNTMDRVISNSKKQNQIITILTKSLFWGLTGYLFYILTLLGSFELISIFFSTNYSKISNSALVHSVICYLALYTYLLIKEMRRNNFCK